MDSLIKIINNVLYINTQAIRILKNTLINMIIEFIKDLIILQEDI